MRKAIVALAVGPLIGSVLVSSAWADGGRKVPTLTGASMSVRTVDQAVVPGGVVKVDIVLNKVANLACYQLALAATGGEQGTLTLKNIVIDTARKDYVFHGEQVIPVVDMVQGRAGAIQMYGGRDVPDAESAYIATGVFRASADAKGVFKINVVAGKETFLRDSDAGAIVCRVGAASKVRIGQDAAPSALKKRGR